MKPFQYKEPLYFTNELDFVIIVSQAIVGTLVNRKLLKDMKDDERNSSPSLIQNVMAFRTKSIMIVIPTFSLLHWSLTLNYRFPDLFYQTLCYEQYNAIFWRFYFGFTSLIISSMRYFFIVHNEKALLLGKERVKKFFELLSVMVPLIMTVLHACTLSVPPSVRNMAHKSCHEFLEISHNMTCLDQTGTMDLCAPILSTVIERIPTVVTKSVGIFVNLMYIIMCSNILDGILYWRTFKMIRE